MVYTHVILGNKIFQETPNISESSGPGGPNINRGPNILLQAPLAVTTDLSQIRTLSLALQVLP